MNTHSSKKDLRKKKFVSKAIQGRLMIRMSLYGLVFMLFVTTVLLLQFCLNHSNGLLNGGPEFVGNLFGKFFAEQLTVMLTFSLFLIPLICIDMMKLSHRFAGQLVRF